MTPEKQRLAIAEAYGFVSHGNSGAWYVDGGMIAGYLEGRFTPIPNYLNDLNAMHEAEKTLTEQQLPHYDELLGPFLWSGYSASTCNWHATAAQRAEAFLRTIGKWQEDPDEYNTYTVVNGVKLYDSDDTK